MKYIKGGSYNRGVYEDEYKFGITDKFKMGGC
jgi:hypothetical protein